MLNRDANRLVSDAARHLELARQTAPNAPVLDDAAGRFARHVHTLASRRIGAAWQDAYDGLRQLADDLEAAWRGIAGWTGWR